MPKGEYLQYGGQAIIEGVMMRSPNFFSVACRAPNGQIIQKTEALEKSWIGRQKWLKFPFLRGSLALIDAMGLGIKAMKFASDVQLDEQYQSEETKEAAAKQGTVQSSKKIQDATIGATMIFSFAFAIFIFVYLPNLVAESAPKVLHQQMSGTLLNFIAGLIKLIFFLGYIWAIGRMKEINEVFKYHGAEHKAINTLEADQHLDFGNCKAQTRLHPRCGTSFAMIVLIITIFLMTFVPRYPLTGVPGNMFKDSGVRFLIDLAILPFIAGISYELLRFAGKFRNQGFVNLMFKPGLWTQYLTTREPDEKQIEVALVALQAVVDAEHEKKNGKGADLIDEPIA